MSARSKPSLGAQLRAALAEVDRLQAEVVRLQARVDVLEDAAAAASTVPRRRGLASLIEGAPTARGSASA